MACLVPLSARFPVAGGAACFKAVEPSRDHLFGPPQEVPCGQCLECCLAKSRDWTVRLVHEGLMHRRSCFVTLTYAPWARRSDESVSLEVLQKAVRRIRRGLPGRIRFFGVGEYGDASEREHYHLVMFGEDFRDGSRVLPRKRGCSYDLWTNSVLQDLWPFGFVSVGAFGAETAAYTAGYAMKKLRGGFRRREPAVDPETGEIVKADAFATMSRMPGLGFSFYAKHREEMWASDSCVIAKGDSFVTLPVPRAYFERLKVEDPERAAAISKSRQERHESKDEREWVREMDSIRREVDAAVEADESFEGVDPAWKRVQSRKFFLTKAKAALKIRRAEARAAGLAKRKAMRAGGGERV